MLKGNPPKNSLTHPTDSHWQTLRFGRSDAAARRRALTSEAKENP